jgi:hypothetical protein
LTFIKGYNAQNIYASTLQSNLRPVKRSLRRVWIRDQAKNTYHVTAGPTFGEEVSYSVGQIVILMKATKNTVELREIGYQHGFVSGAFDRFAYKCAGRSADPLDRFDTGRNLFYVNARG